LGAVAGVAGRGAVVAGDDGGVLAGIMLADSFGAAFRAVLLRAGRALRVVVVLLRFAPARAPAPFATPFFALRAPRATVRRFTAPLLFAPFARPPFLPDRFDFLPVRAIKPPVSGLKWQQPTCRLSDVM
jgi:hypothetical protein